ncbi:MAG TPA: aminotransferase class V-fold PLP-dependent enzyme [Herpetosiphonaceae bacterium]|nr:aminotransferase class V-fold PLP-dependent enzyme [Herpetosiphonaceae bacterium]
MPHRSLTGGWEDYRAEFPTCERTTYLNTCSLGALSRRSRAAVQFFLDLWEEHGASAWYATWLDEVAALRADFERLVNAPAGSVAIHHSISSALSVVASCYPYTGRNRIITTALDFPTIPYQWLVKEGVEVITLPSPDGIAVPIEAWAAAIDERTALVATSHVFFTSGYIQPIAELAHLAHAAGAHIVVDGYQAAGQLPVDVAALHVDYYLAGGLKWLLGGPGIVELYVRPGLLPELRPSITGWFAHGQQFRFDPESFAFSDDARRLELGTPAVAAVYAARAGLDLLLEIGIPAIRAREQELVDDLVARARDAGLRVKLPADRDQHAGILMFPAEDPASIVRALKAERIVVDYRPGHVRVSPYFYNTVDEHALLIERLRTLIQAQ